MKSDRMKKTAIILLGLALAAGCAKSPQENLNLVNKQVLEAWLSKNYPGAKASGNGIYILEDEQPAGEAAAVGTEGWVYLDYTTTSLDEKVTQTTFEDVARRVKLYSASKYFGPVVQSLDKSVLPAGMESLFDGMKVGGRRKALVPGWLLSTERHSTPEEYLEQTTDNSSLVYEVRVVDYFTDVAAWQKEKIAARFAELYGAADPAQEGFWYHRTGAPDNEDALTAEDEIYINYVGRFLDGKVFDTNVLKVARDAGIEKSSTTYRPAKITWASQYSDLKMTTAGSTSATSVVSGFALTLWQMHAHEKGVGMFWSDLGYGSAGQSPVPAYCPLMFEIELVDEQ